MIGRCRLFSCAVFAVVALVFSVSGGSFLAAQTSEEHKEQQVYNRLAPSAGESLAVQTARERVAAQRQALYGANLSVGGKTGRAPVVYRRDPYLRYEGALPRHPGDYRDAYDRGQWQGGSDKTPSPLFSAE